MIKLEKCSVMNFENAIRGARNPMNSWERGDSEYCSLEKGCYLCMGCKNHIAGCFILGENDIDLAKRLCRAGSDHRKFLRQVFVSIDITAPLYWWKEYDTYKVGTTANSTSTMHKIHAKPFTLDDFSMEKTIVLAFGCFHETLRTLNTLRDLYNETKDKDYWYSMIQLLPSSYNQMRTCTMTYENLINMYHARKNHKLDEWHVFCEWVEGLPYMKEFTGVDK